MAPSLRRRPKRPGRARETGELVLQARLLNRGVGGPPMAVWPLGALELVAEGGGLVDHGGDVLHHVGSSPVPVWEQAAELVDRVVQVEANAVRIGAHPGPRVDAPRPGGQVGPLEGLQLFTLDPRLTCDVVDRHALPLSAGKLSGIPLVQSIYRTISPRPAALPSAPSIDPSPSSNGAVSDSAMGYGIS